MNTKRSGEPAVAETLDESQPGPAVIISGLRNPPAAVRGMGMAAMLLEAVVLLLALQPVRQFSPWNDAVALGVTGALALLCLLAASMLRRDWGWRFATAAHVAVIAGGVVHWSLAVLGVLFLLVWRYVLHVRRTVLNGAER